MRIANEFVVAASLEETWEALLDVPRVASALPGATIEPSGGGDEHRGRLKLKLGPITVEYAGTARLQEVDEAARTASFYVQGSGGQGSAAATIVNRVEAVEGGTRVSVETDLKVTGRAAQFGRGLMEDVAGRMLAEFARRLEAEIRTPAVSETSQRPLGDVSETSQRSGDALDVGSAAWRPLLERYALPALVALVLVLLLRRPKVIVIREP